MATKINANGSQVPSTLRNIVNSRCISRATTTTSMAMTTATKPTSRRQSTRVGEVDEVNRRDQRKDDGRGDGVNDERPIERRLGEPDSHRRTTQGPAGKGVRQSDSELAQ